MKASRLEAVVEEDAGSRGLPAEPPAGQPPQPERQPDDALLPAGGQAAPRPTARSLRRRVFDLAWPVISENFLQTLLGITDTIMVAQLGPAALAGVGAAIQFMFFVISALSATSVGSSVLVAQAFGARNLDRASRVAKQSLVWSVIISIPLALAGLFAAEPLIAIFGMEPEVSAIGADYLRVVMGTVVFLTLMLLSGGVLRGVGDSRTPMLITLAANVVNVVFTYGLIFGELGMPELGAVGSAWGTFISRVFGFALLFWVLWRGVNGISIRGAAGWLPNFGLARQILKIGIPAATEQMLNSVAFLTMSIVVAQLGTLALAAHRVALNTMSISFLPGFGFAMAATALVGQSIGARRPDEGQAVAGIATVWAVIWMSTLGIVFLFWPELILRLFTDDPVVMSYGAAGLRAIALTQPFMAINMVQAGSLRGTGDSQYPLRVGTTSIWAAVILGALLVNTLGGGLTSIWGAFLFTSPINAYLLWRRFQRTITSAEPAPVAT
ncbi:MAG TPA: MATE family efflux transporter [Caldilineaceae bacterium]|nr:MATE family efflux transporter [Caldilineaceae bacterium]